MTLTARPLTDDDQAQLISFLRPHSATSLFILSNQAKSGLQPGTAPFSGRYFGLFQTTQLIAVLVQYWNGIVMMQGEQQAVSTLWEACSPGLSSINGFIGPAALCRHLRGLHEQSKPHGREQHSPTLAIDSSEWLYTLSLDASLPQPSSHKNASTVHCRLATPDDIPKLLRWRMDFQVARTNAQPGPVLAKNCEAELSQHIQTDSVFLLTHDEVPVSMCLFTARFEQTVQIGGVWTPPAQRNQGFGRGVVAGALTIAAERHGVNQAILFTHADNRAAQAAYKAIGFERAGEFGLFIYAPP